MAAKKLNAERIPLDRGGYDKRGRYYGVGPKLYHVYSDSGDLSEEVRASGVKEAKARALAQHTERYRYSSRRNPCAPVANPRECRGRGPEGRRIIRCKGKRNPENPRSHYPKTARGRPPVKRKWHLELFASSGVSLGRKTLTAPATSAHAQAKKLVGKRHGKGTVHKVILDGPH
jgi:hypothetical protein